MSTAALGATAWASSPALAPALALTHAAKSGRSKTGALAGLDDEVLALMERFQVPGLAMAVVSAEEVLLLKGYGVVRQGHAAPMTHRTVLPIASITKTMTALAVTAALRERGLGFDARVSEWLPSFELINAEVTRSCTVRDLLAHRTGLPRHDWVWMGSRDDPATLMTRLAHLETSAPFRQRFQYSNLLYMVLGQLAAQLDGAHWADAVRQRVLDPVSMRRSGTSLRSWLEAPRAATDSPDLASGHDLGLNGQVQMQAYQELHGMSAMGAVVSCAEDMAAYLQALLRSGSGDHTPGSKALVHPDDLAEMMRPQAMVHHRSPYIETGRVRFGLGFSLSMYRGMRLVHHTGDLPGTCTMLMMAPDERWGFFIAANMTDTRLRDALPFMLMDRLSGLDRIDWGQRFWHEQKDQRTTARAALDRARNIVIASTLPSVGPDAPARLRGHYHHPGYGEMIIRSGDEGALELEFHGQVSRLYRRGTWFYEVLPDPADRLGSIQLRFEADGQARVQRLLSPLELSVAPIAFIKVDA